MRLLLRGSVVYDHTGGMSRDKILHIDEDFDAENLEIALLIARAMLESARRKVNKDASGWDQDEMQLEATLTDASGKILWKAKFHSRKLEWDVVKKTSAHFEEELVE